VRFIDRCLPGFNREPERTLRGAVARAVGRRQLLVYRRIAPAERAWNVPFRNF